MELIVSILAEERHGGIVPLDLSPLMCKQLRGRFAARVTLAACAPLEPAFAGTLLGTRGCTSRRLAATRHEPCTMVHSTTNGARRNAEVAVRVWLRMLPRSRYRVSTCSKRRQGLPFENRRGFASVSVRQVRTAHVMR